MNPINSNDLEKYNIKWYSSNEIPANPPKQFIFNWDDSEGPGTHWCAVKRLKEGIFYFDPLCFPMHQAVAKFLSEKNIKDYYCNAVKCQLETDVICGHLCILFVKKVNNLSSANRFLKNYQIQTFGI